MPNDKEPKPVKEKPVVDVTAADESVIESEKEKFPLITVDKDGKEWIEKKAYDALKDKPTSNGKVNRRVEHQQKEYERNKIPKVDVAFDETVSNHIVVVQHNGVKDVYINGEIYDLKTDFTLAVWSAVFKSEKTVRSDTPPNNTPV